MIHRSICNDLRKNLDKFKHKELLFYFAYILSNTSQIQLFISLSILLKYFFIYFSNLYQFLSILHHTSHNPYPILFIFTARHTTISLYFCYHPHQKTKGSRPIQSEMMAVQRRMIFGSSSQRLRGLERMRHIGTLWRGSGQNKIEKGWHDNNCRRTTHSCQSQ